MHRWIGYGRNPSRRWRCAQGVVGSHVVGAVAITVAISALTGAANAADGQQLLDETLVAYATAAGTTAADGDGRNSPYAAALLAHLEHSLPTVSTRAPAAGDIPARRQPGSGELTSSRRKTGTAGERVSR